MANDQRWVCGYAEANIGLDDGGRLSPCCRFQSNAEYPLPEAQTHSLKEAFRHSTFERLRTELRAGRFPPPCISCANEDKAGMDGHRMGLARRYSDLKRESVQSLEIFVGDLCNMSCRMCDANSSSQWKKELGLAPSPPAVPFSKLFAGLDLSQIKVVKFLGGETLINARLTEVLDLLIEGGRAEEMSIDIVTNGSIPPRPEIVKRLARFGHLELIFSIDGTGELAEYIRRGVAWSKIADSIAKWCDLARSEYAERWHLAAHTTLQATNYAAIGDILDFCLAHGLKHWTYRQLDGPNELQVTRLPQAQRRRIAASLLAHPRATEFQNYLARTERQGTWNHLTKVVPDLASEPTEPLLSYLEKFDRRWNLRWQDHLSEEAPIDLTDSSAAAELRS